MRTTIERAIYRYLAAGLALLFSGAVSMAAEPVLVATTARPLRYHPEGTDFVIENGKELFNRPLYCCNTAFRIDGGDVPEFSLYVPGRGGNFRLGIKAGDDAKWLNDAEAIVTRYRPGSLLYDVRDPLLHGAKLNITALAMSETQGLIVRAELSEGSQPVELIWAFGGANGDRGNRGGDVGCERLPVSQFFALKPEYCKADQFNLNDRGFVMQAKPAVIDGITPPGSKLAIGDGGRWGSAKELIDSAGGRRWRRCWWGELRFDRGSRFFWGCSG